MKGLVITYVSPTTSITPFSRRAGLISRRQAGKWHSGQHPVTRKASSMQLRQKVWPHPDTVLACFMVSEHMLHCANASTADIIC